MWTDRNRSDATNVTTPYVYDTDDEIPPPPPPPDTPPPIYPYPSPESEIPPPPPLEDIPLSAADEETPTPPTEQAPTQYSRKADYGAKESSEPPEVELELKLFKQLERARNKEVHQANKKKRSKKPVPPHVQKRRRTFAICAVVLFLVVIAVGLGVGLTSKKRGGGDSATSSSTQEGDDASNVETIGPIVTNCLSMELEGVTGPLPSDAVAIFENEYCAHFQEYYNSHDTVGINDVTDLQLFVDVTQCSVDVGSNPAESCGLSNRFLRSLQGITNLPFSQTMSYELQPGSSVQPGDVIEGPFLSEEAREEFANRLRYHPSTSAFKDLTGVSGPVGPVDDTETEEGSDSEGGGDEPTGTDKSTGTGEGNDIEDGSDAPNNTDPNPETGEGSDTDVGGDVPPDPDAEEPAPSPTPGDDETAGGGDDGSDTANDVPVPSPPEEAPKPAVDPENDQPGPKSKPKPGDADDADAPEHGWGYVNEILSNIFPPEFPNADFLITDYGADDMGRADSTSSFKDAIAACHEAGGGRVVVPAGTYSSGPIHLKSNVNLHVMEGATIEFSTDEEDYEPLVLTRFEGMELNNYSPLIYAFEQENIAVTGDGVLDGRAADWNWWEWYIDGRQDEAYESLLRKAEREDMSRNFGDNDYLRPNFIQPYRCKNVLIQGVTIMNSPMWTINPVLSSNVIVRGVTVESSGPDNDGVSVESCKNVLIEDSTFDVSEDCVSIKSGRNGDGRRVNVPSEDVVVRNVRMVDGRGGLTLGSEVSGGVNNVYAHNIAMDDVDYAFNIKTNSVRGGVVEHIYLREITVDDADEASINIDFEYAEGDDGDFDPTVQKIDIRDWTSNESRRGLVLRGYERAPIKDIRLTNVDFGRTFRDNVVEHVDGLKIRD